MKSFGDIMKWRKEQKASGVEPMRPTLMGKPKPSAAELRAAFPLAPVDWGALAAPPSDAIQAVWVGHATVLVQMGGATFLTDPVFSERCSPTQLYGPKRVAPPALTAADPLLTRLDFVLLSHNHYDHLDTDSVRALNKRFGQALTWYVPLGVGRWFASEGVKSVREMDWWESAEHPLQGGGSVTVTMTPAQHWSARGILDRFQTLWGGFVVTAPAPPPAPSNLTTSSSSGPSPTSPASAPASSTPSPPDASAGPATPAAPAAAGPKGGAEPLRFYFVGDTGYGPFFPEIGKRLGPFDLAAIPIGAYEPRWFMKPQHVNAEEGLQIAQEVGARVSIGIHTATWVLTDEPLDEPPARLEAAVRAAGLPPTSFVTLQHGAMAVVRGGELVNAPPTLPVEASEKLPAAAAAPSKAKAEAASGTAVVANC
ncbi:hypothetical protein HYH03_015205 [Edaphochlamys debaryana]|uniref:Metallo-beta-lactamase domain-containing protein n=1 Tax=Edaphochlamys debaryana TaxID=47281 RepID=A0A835XSH1_9CHLO|nr:hypothetical protein HYH03_015205 [Edaphochlamys debaryana]|eukprot:KAG2486110.1 hypothetical protein HYH03_015205 [Edaphochlamys debaryana]